MHGRAREELVGRLAEEVFAPAERALLAPRVRIAAERGQHTFDSEHVHADGSVFPVLIDVTAAKDDQGRTLHFVVCVRDITDHRRAPLDAAGEANQRLPSPTGRRAPAAA